MSTLYQVILEGIDSAKPSAGIRGRLYFTTDTNLIYYDTGPAWLVVGPTGSGSANINITGLLYGNGNSNITAATSGQVQSVIGAGVYDPAGTAANLAPKFETNGNLNSNQAVLNLVAGGNITLTNTTNGNVVISSTTSGGANIALETNGVLNSDQAVLNLVAGSNISLTNSGGNVSVACILPIFSIAPITPGGNINGNGSANIGNRIFTLPSTPIYPNASFYFLGGIKQVYGNDYSISGNVLSYLGEYPPTTGTVHEIYYS